MKHPPVAWREGSVLCSKGRCLMRSAISRSDIARFYLWILLRRSQIQVRQRIGVPWCQMSWAKSRCCSWAESRCRSSTVLWRICFWSFVTQIRERVWVSRCSRWSVVSYTAGSWGMLIILTHHWNELHCTAHQYKREQIEGETVEKLGEMKLRVVPHRFC